MTQFILRSTALTFWLTLLLFGPAEADDSYTVSLLRPDSLAGWEYGGTTDGWTISDGRLSGNEHCTPLLSGWTFGDFELSFEWSASGGGAWQIGLPVVPGKNPGPNLTWTLREGDDSGALRAADKKLLAGVKIGPANDGWHTALLSRRAAKLSLKIDDKSLGEVEIGSHDRYGLSLRVSGGNGAVRNLQAAEPRGQSIFNGKDLTGWWTPGNRASWVVEPSTKELACLHQGGNYLRSEKEYGNFTFSMEYKTTPHCNSGVGIRTARNAWPSGDGMELQIYDEPGLNKHSTMAIYGNVEPFSRADKSQEWNRVVIKADGRMISAWINAQLVQQTNTAWMPELKHRHLQGWIGFQDHGGDIHFRDIRVLEAPPGLGLAEWSRPHGGVPIEALLDRLMNSQRVASALAIDAAVVAQSVPEKSQQVLADLMGPGALVRLWRTDNSGHIQCFFDGEDKPRIDCPAAQLAEHVPVVAEDHQPLLMCLPFAKRLRVVLSGAQAGDCRLDYVSFHKDATQGQLVPQQSFHGAHTTIPRGWLSALNYREHQLGGGTHREADPYRRLTGEPQTIQPGAVTKLVSCDGAGTVLWLKLVADPAVLNNSDLWLDITVDGQSAPAISAPARFLFPALVGGENHDNLVMTNRSGPTNLLAMPFAAGISIAARNQGRAAISNIGAAMSVDQTNPDSAAAGPIRLRGLFQPADSSGNLIEQTGRGRWVAFVHQQPADGRCGVGSLVVDGVARDGWQRSDLDAFFGRPAGERDFYRVLSGSKAGLAWRYLLMEAVTFEKSLVVKPNPGDKLGDRLALFYSAP